MEIELALTKINDLIAEISRLYEDVCDAWVDHSQRNGIRSFNQKSKKIVDIEDEGLMPIIKEYTQFLRDLSEIIQFDHFEDGFIVNQRIKNNNSIEEKYDEYLNVRKEKGEVSINKCFNDLFGIRAIVASDELTYELLEKNIFGRNLLIEEKDVISNKFNIRYKATHVYFKRDNTAFRWELQIWRMCDEHSNQESHLNHRYRYTEWESQSRNTSTI